MARIIVASYVVRLPLGGYQSWMLQWLLGFQRLGHDVYFVEKSGWPNSCFDPSTGQMGDDCSYGTESFRRLLDRFGMADRWCYVDSKGSYHGLSRQRVEDLFRSADVFVDHMRDCEWESEASSVEARVMVDAEPAYTQMRLEKMLRAGFRPPIHNYFFSVGLNVGGPSCAAPALGRQWRPIFDPVNVDLFPTLAPKNDAPFTTVMSWREQEEIEYNGRTYGLKDVEFDKFADLPRRVRAPLELAISGKGVPTQRLIDSGWRLRDAHRATISFDSWRDYISSSKGEFSVCKNYYVATNSGAFSDRSAVYLACGRPVVMQDTGFSDHLPCGRGLFAVRDVEAAAAAIEQIQGDYELHSAAAREIAEEYLEASRVLGKFLNDIGL